MNDTIFVTGSSGMLGYELHDFLTRRMMGPVVGISRQERQAADQRLINHVDQAPLGAGWMTNGALNSTIVHCAGLSNPRRAFDSLSSLTELEITPQIRFAEALVDRGWRGHLILVSSGGAVYGDVETLPIAETAPRQPKGFYGLAKVVVEDNLAFLARKVGFRLTILRVANPYGARIRKPDQGVIPVILDAALGDKAFRMLGNGEELRDYIHISDFTAAVAGACQLADGPLVNIFNIGSGKGTSLRQLIQIISDLSGRQITFDAQPSALDVRSNVLDITQARVVLGWSPKIRIEDGLRILIDDELVRRAAN